MATVSQQVTNVTARFKKDPNNRAISATTILTFLNEAQDIIEARVVLPAMQASSTIDLVADQQEYSLASDIDKPILFRYTANDWVLKEQSLLSIQNKFDDSTGTPQEYYYFGGSVGFYPIPSANEAQGVKYWYLKTLGELVESGAGAGQVTTSEVPEKFHWVLERGAEMLVAQMFGYGDRAERAEIKFEQGIKAMKDHYMVSTANYDTELYALDDFNGERAFNFNPYQ